MADAYFGFDTNVEEVAGRLEAGAQRVERATREMANAMADASRGVATPVPLNFADQLVRNVQDGVRRAQVEMERAFAPLRDPQGLAQIRQQPGGIRGYSTNMLEQVGTNMFNNVRLQIDTALRQLDPQARFQLMESGQLGNMLNEARTTVITTLENDFAAIRQSLDANVRRGLPRAPDLGPAIEQVNQSRAAIFQAEEERLARIYQVERDEETGVPVRGAGGRLEFLRDELDRPIPVSAAQEVAAAHQAVQQQVSAQNRQSQEALKESAEAARRAERELAAQIGRGLVQQDPFLRAVGVFSHPETGEPVRRTTQGAAPLTNQLDLARALADAERLRESVEATRRLMADPEFARIGTSAYYQRGATGEIGEGEYYRLGSTGGIQHFERIDDALGREVDAARAREARYRELAGVSTGADREAQRIAREQARRSGFAGGVGQGLFGRGFGSDVGMGLDTPAALTNIGQTVGSAVRYSVAYGGFYELIQISQGIVNAFVDFQDSMTDYEVAVGSSSVVTESLIGDMQELSRVVGENVGTSFDAAARTVRAFGDLAKDTPDMLNQIGIAGAEASQMMAVITGKKQTDATGDIVSIGSAYQMRPEELQRIPNIIAAAKRVGGDPAQIAQGLSNIAVAANEAGFSLEEAANMISLVQARTDQSGQAVATRLSRVFSIISGTTGQRLAEQITRVQPDTPVDTEDSVREQIQQIARAYARAGPELQGLIRSQLGGTSNVRELLPLLTEFPRLQEAVRFTLQNPDAGFDEYTRKIENFVGTLNKIKGAVQNIAVDLVKADIFAPIGAGIIILERALDAIDRLLTAYNQLTGLVDLPGPVGALLTGGVEVGLGAMAVNRLRRSTFVGEVAEGTGIAAVTARRVAVESTATAAIGTAATRRAAAESALIASETRLAAATTGTAVAMSRAGVAMGTAMWGAVGGGIAGGLARGGVGLAGLLGKGAGLLRAHPILAALGVGLGAYTVGSNIYDDQQLLDRVGGRANRAFRTAGGDDLSPQEFRDTAQLLRTERARLETEITGISGFFSSEREGAHRQLLLERAQVLESWARTTEAEAARVTQENEYAQALNRVSVMGVDAVHTAEDLAEGLERLRQSGFGARDRLETLITTLTNPPSPITQASITPGQYTQGLAASLFGGITAENLPTGITPGVGGMHVRSPEQVYERMIEEGRLGKDALFRSQQAMADALAAFELKPGETPTAAQLQQVVRAGINAVNFGGLGIKPDDLMDFKNQLLQQVLNRTKGYRDLLAGIEQEAGPLSTDDVDAIMQETQAYIGEVSPYDGFGTMQIGALRRSIDTLRQGRTATNAGVVNDAIRNLQHQLREAQVNRLLQLMAAAESQIDPDDTAAIRANRAKWLGRAVARAGNDTQQLLAVMQAGDRQSLAIVRASMERALLLAQQALQASQAFAALINESGVPAALDALGAAFAGGLGGGGEGGRVVPRAARRRVNRLQEQLENFDEALKLVDIPATTADAAGGGEAADRLTPAQRAAMIAGATIAPDDTVAAARNAMDKARADMDAAKQGSQEYYAALEAYTQARDQYTKAVASRTAAFALASVDPDDAVGQAAAQLQGARAQLAATTPGTEAYANALAQVNQQQDAYQDAVVAQANAAREAEAARVGGQIASARASLAGAAATMRVTARGTTEWYGALAQYYQAQQALRDAVAAHAYVLDQLAGDMTDPVEQARDALRDVRRRLNAAIRAGQAPDVIDALRLEEEQSQHAHERAAFDQRMQDAQTAQELGRMSFAAYMRYLQSEHDRLSAIKNRTRQQQDMLNEVDLAMKQAGESMEGQFNLGDIRLPTPYQVRRWVEEQAGSAVMQATARNVTPQQLVNGVAPTQQTQNVEINIDGADTRKVKQILTDVLGNAQRRKTTAPRRR